MSPCSTRFSLSQDAQLALANICDRSLPDDRVAAVGCDCVDIDHALHRAG
jgi:hypothetical protein